MPNPSHLQGEDRDPSLSTPPSDQNRGGECGTHRPPADGIPTKTPARVAPMGAQAENLSPVVLLSSSGGTGNHNFPGR